MKFHPNVLQHIVALQVNPRQFRKRGILVILCLLKEEKAEEESVIAPATVARIARLSDTVSLVVSFDSLGS